MDAVVSCESDEKYLVLCLSCLARVLTCRVSFVWYVRLVKEA